MSIIPIGVASYFCVAFSMQYKFLLPRRNIWLPTIAGEASISSVSVLVEMISNLGVFLMTSVVPSLDVRKIKSFVATGDPYICLS